MPRSSPPSRWSWRSSPPPPRRATPPASPAGGGPRGAQNGEWPTYHGDLYATQYAPLDQITADNVSKLAVAWNWDSPDNAIVAADQKFQPWGFKSTPLMIGGELYVNTSLGHVASIDAATGKTLWVFDSKSREAGRPTNLGFNSRGVGYWTDGKEERVFHPVGRRHAVGDRRQDRQGDRGFRRRRKSRRRRRRCATSRAAARSR